GLMPEAPILRSIAAICIGASLGALLRWLLGSRLNHYFPAIPMGTLAANLVGGYIIGAAIAWFAMAPAISPEWRLFIITGSCGGLTTFSTFSAEIVSLLQGGRAEMAIVAAALHLFGSVMFTLAGMATVMWTRG